MNKIGTKKIQVSSCEEEEFDVYPCNCKIGDTIWFDDGFPDENGRITEHQFMHGKVIAIDPDHWWIYDDGNKELGTVTVKVEGDAFYTGQNFSVAFKDIIYEEPVDSVIINAQKLLTSCQHLQSEMNKMNEGISFLQNEYKTNKRYFCNYGRCTVNDVIKTVFEFAWAASKIYYLDKDENISNSRHAK